MCLLSSKVKVQVPRSQLIEALLHKTKLTQEFKDSVRRPGTRPTGGAVSSQVVSRS